jgi:hypothetical protein
MQKTTFLPKKPPRPAIGDKKVQFPLADIRLSACYVRISRSSAARQKIYGKI